MSPRTNRLYLDNAATSFPKPREVLDAMVHYATEIGASAGRGGYAEARASAAVLATCRQQFNSLFNGEHPNHFIFTLNCTDALNLAIHGILRPGDHAIATAMDHNSVLRPLGTLQAAGTITYTVVPVDPITCLADPQDIARAIRPNTRLIAAGHGSNVTGTLQRVREIGRIARQHNIPFLVDAAQTAGHVPIDVQADCIDLLAFPGHKGLLGPLGTGALYIRPGLEKILRPLRQGGTGTNSEKDTQPEMLPDKYESGSHNAIGIAGLSAGLAWIQNRTVEKIWEHERGLCNTFMEAIDGVEGLRFLGPQGIKDRRGVFSVLIGDLDPIAIADRLEREFGMLVRAGLHCAPLAHKTLGTSPFSTPAPTKIGTTRLSFGPLLELTDIQFAADALASIALEHSGAATPAHPLAAGNRS